MESEQQGKTVEKFGSRSSKGRSAIPLFTVLILLGLLHSAPAKSGCPNWSDANVNGSSSWIYGGSVGGRAIRMALRLDPTTRTLSGTYGYSNQPGVLSVSGAISADGETASLDERDSDGQKTGHFTLNFVYPTWQEGWDRDGKKSGWNCMFMAGTWKGRASLRPAKVKLNRINPLSSDSNEELARKKNEDAAYQLQQAVLRNDRAKFASLLKYPFFTQSLVNHQAVWKKWGGPEDVIKNYKKIMMIRADEMRSAVPHELETSFGTSAFMGTYACITDGKFVQICNGGCRCPPYD